MAGSSVQLCLVVHRFRAVMRSFCGRHSGHVNATLPVSPFLRSGCDLSGSRWKLLWPDRPDRPCRWTPAPGFSPGRLTPPSTATQTETEKKHERQSRSFSLRVETSSQRILLPRLWFVCIQAAQCSSACPPPAGRSSSHTWSCQTEWVATQT